VSTKTRASPHPHPNRGRSLHWLDQLHRRPGPLCRPFIVGHLVTRSGSFASGLTWLLVNIFLAGILVLRVR